MMAGTFELDADTDLEPLGDGRYRGTMTDRWTVAAGPNGGYVAAFALRAVLAESAFPDPLTMTVHYLARPSAGPADVLVETLRVGRGHATIEFRLVQGDLKAAGLVTLGRLRDRGEHDFAPGSPVLDVSPDDAVPIGAAIPPGSSSAGAAIPPGSAPPGSAIAPRSGLFERVDLRVASAGDVFFLREEPGAATTGGWTRLADGRPADALAVPLFLDCWPPAVCCRTMAPSPTGAPTLELTVHWRDRPGPGWHWTHFETRLVNGGYMDESGELWTADGRLVAESRQLARY